MGNISSNLPNHNKRTSLSKEKSSVKDWYNLIAENFDKRYGGEEGFYWQNFESKIVDELVNVKNKVVLDLGCGGGRYALSVCKKAQKVIGIDISDKLISIAKSKPTPDAPVEFIMGDAESTCFKDGGFDMIVSLGLFEYSEDLTPFFSEVNRILKTGGIFLFTCHNKNKFSVVNIVRNSKFISSILRPMLAPMRSFFFPRSRKSNEQAYYGLSLNKEKRLYRKVAFRLKEIDRFLELNKLRRVDFRTFSFKFSDKLFRFSSKMQSVKLRNIFFAISIFINSFFGRFMLTKGHGRNLIIKSKKMG